MDGCVVMACHENERKRMGRRREEREEIERKEIEDKQELLSRVTGKD